MIRTVGLDRYPTALAGFQIRPQHSVRHGISFQSSSVHRDTNPVSISFYKLLAYAFQTFFTLGGKVKEAAEGIVAKVSAYMNHDKVNILPLRQASIKQLNRILSQRPTMDNIELMQTAMGELISTGARILEATPKTYKALITLATGEFKHLEAGNDLSSAELHWFQMQPILTWATLHRYQHPETEIHELPGFQELKALFKSSKANDFQKIGVLRGLVILNRPSKDQENVRGFLLANPEVRDLLLYGEQYTSCPVRQLSKAAKRGSEQHFHKVLQKIIGEPLPKTTKTKAEKSLKGPLKENNCQLPNKILVHKHH